MRGIASGIFFSGTAAFGTSGTLKILVFSMIRQSKGKWTVSSTGTLGWLPLVGGTSGFLGSASVISFSGMSSLGASGA